MTQSAQQKIVIDNNTTSTKPNYEIALGVGPSFSMGSICQCRELTQRTPEISSSSRIDGVGCNPKDTSSEMPSPTNLTPMQSWTG
jgi:hypothetical protein